MSGQKVLNLLQQRLGSAIMKPYGRAGGGCINEGEGYMTDGGPIFVKKNKSAKSKLMFDGEYESLKALGDTQTIRVPKPLAVVENPSGGAVFAAEYLDMGKGHKYEAEMGIQLARLHLHNSEMLKPESERASWVGGRVPPVKKFGFHTTTCCGYIPQDNTWTEDWVEFFTEKRLQHQVNLINEDHHDGELNDCWAELKKKIPSFFKNCPPITPALLHGDLWSGNFSETESEPVVFDPATFYGHSEFDFGIATMFGGFGSKFYNAYHSVLPKAPGFDRRVQLYQLFHHLNHWNHFGTSYRGSSLSLMKRLARSAE